jgi:plasmid stabilization system protein ParE
MLTRIEYHPKAEEEFEASTDWYLQGGRAAAEGFRATVDKAIDLVIISGGGTSVSSWDPTNRGD